jgi:4-amino-4-deoxy-L-arabinose transferase-like glycosyltransferase
VTALEGRARLLWPATVLLALFAYFYSLGGFYIPTIGDESPYIEIVRLTSASGKWLPLATAPGLENTKPPLLFWLGMVATDWARTWSLFRLRLPIVLLTFVTAGAVFWVARRLSGDREVAIISSLTFLGFYSTFHYGRPFLTNLPETLFVFLAFAVVIFRRDRLAWTLCGLLLGVACLFKSFALVAPVGLALAWFCFSARKHRFIDSLTSDGLGLALALVVALATFALWPLLDPDPAAILKHFVLEENLGKLGGGNYLTGLVSGPYPLYRIWAGHVGNAGLFTPPLLFVAFAAYRDRKRSSEAERALWILVVSFLIVYSLPSQRQENYLIPTVPALSVLLGLRWRAIPSAWFRLFAIPGILLAVAFVLFMHRLSGDARLHIGYESWQLAVPLLALIGWIAMAMWPRRGRWLFHGLVFAAFLSIGCSVAPFEADPGRFDLARVRRLRGRTVYVPTEFISRYEKYRFLLPGSKITGYDPSDANRLGRLLESGKVVVIHRPVGVEPEGPFRVLARRFDLSSRHTWDEMRRIVIDGRIDILVRQELIVRRFRRQRLLGNP